VGYFYFKFDDPAKSTTGSLLRSLLKQFDVLCPRVLEELYNRDARDHPTEDELRHALHLILQGCKRPFIIVDALDECTDREQLLAFIDEIVNWRLPTLQLLVTSRPEQDFFDGLEALVTCEFFLEDALVSEDIKNFIQERINQNPKSRRWPEDVRNEIESNLLRGADGM
jgi:hypothetical protein